MQCQICAEFIDLFLRDLTQLESFLVFFPGPHLLWRFDEHRVTELGLLIKSMERKIKNFQKHLIFTDKIKLDVNLNLLNFIYSTIDNLVYETTITSPQLTSYINEIKQYKNGKPTRLCPIYRDQIKCISIGNYDPNISDDMFLRISTIHEEFIRWRFCEGEVPNNIKEWLIERYNKLELEKCLNPHRCLDKNKSLEYNCCREAFEGEDLSFNELYMVYGDEILKFQQKN